MAQAKTNPTTPKAGPSNWVLIVEELFPLWRDRLGSSKDAKDEVTALLCHPETRSQIQHRSASGEVTPGTPQYPNAEFWRYRLLLVPDADGGADHLAVDYPDSIYLPEGHWESFVRRFDVERWEGLYPALAAPPPAPSKEPTSAPAPSEQLSNKPRQKPGPKPDFDWAKIEAKCYALMDHHGAFDASDPEWDCQARLEEALNKFCLDKWQREPGSSTLRKKLPEWLSTWRLNKQGG